MSRPATAIEADIRLALSTCAIDARGLFHEMRYLIENHSDRPGHLQQNGRPISDSQLARAAGSESDCVARLLQELVDVGLIERSGECWLSSPLAKVAHLRDRGAVRVREHRKKERELRNTPCNTKRNADVTPNPSPPFSPPPRPLSPLTPTTLLFPSETGDAAAAAAEVAPAVLAKSSKRSKNADRKLTDEQNAARTAFISWWCGEAYPKAMGGGPYDFAIAGKKNGKAVKELMEAVGYDLERAMRIALAYLADDDQVLKRKGKPLYLMNDLQKYAQVAERGLKLPPGGFYGNSKPYRAPARDAAGARAGEFAEQGGRLAALAQRTGQA